VGKIAQIIEKIAPLDQAEEWDNVGLMLGRMDMPVKRLMTTVDITSLVVKEAIDNRIDMIISHHPLIFKPLYSLREDSAAGRIIYPLIENGIAVYCAHTNLDKAVGGTDDALAESLELKDIRRLDETNSGSSFGRIGILEQPMDIIQFAEKVCKLLKAQRIDIAGKREKQVKTVAVAGGAGAGIMKKALTSGADVLVTGEIKHHEAIEAELLGVPVLAAGHFFTELPVMVRLIDRLQMMLDSLQYNIDITLSKLQKSPYVSI